MNVALGWVFLVTSGLVDVAWALATKNADGFREPAWAALSLALLLVLVTLLTKALQVQPLGVAYAVWTGIGAIGSVVAGVLLFGESAEFVRILFVAVTAIGVIGLKMTG